MMFGCSSIRRILDSFFREFLEVSSLFLHDFTAQILPFVLHATLRTTQLPPSPKWSSTWNLLEKLFLFSISFGMINCRCGFDGETGIFLYTPDCPRMFCGATLLLRPAAC